MIKKLFYFLVILAIIVAIDHPKINEFYDNTLGEFKMFAREGLKTTKNPGGAKVYRDISQHFSSYSQGEIEMIDTLTKDNQKVLKFRQDYCVNGDFNPVIYGDHLKQLCQIIERHKKQLMTVVK